MKAVILSFLDAEHAAILALRLGAGLQVPSLLYAGMEYPELYRRKIDVHNPGEPLIRCFWRPVEQKEIPTIRDTLVFQKRE